MIFAAGLGTRLRPLTNHLPKALVPVDGHPLLEIAIRRLIHYGFREIIINVHHFAEQIEAFLQERQNFGVDIILSHEKERPLETGGGLKKVQALLEDAPFLVINADVITDLDLDAFCRFHRHHRGLASLAIRQRQTTRYLLFDDQRQLVGWRNARTGAEKMARPDARFAFPFGFSGVQAIDPQIFSFMPTDQEVFSIIEVYLKAARTESIFGYPHSEDIWLDVGKPEQLAAASKVIDRILSGID
jgi:NDP-sugar pyrophosphorylase family protein